MPRTYHSEAGLRVPADGPRRRRVERRERLRAHEGARQRDAVRPDREGLHLGLVVQDPVLGDRVDLWPDERPGGVGDALEPGDRVELEPDLAVDPAVASGSGLSSNRPTTTAGSGGRRHLGRRAREVGREPDPDRDVHVDMRTEVGERRAARHRPLDLGDHDVARAQRPERVEAVAQSVGGSRTPR